MSEPKLEPRVLIPEIKIKSRVSEMAQEISQDLSGKEIVAICILKGSFVFFADIIRAIDLPMKCEFLGLSSYEGMATSGEVKTTLDINSPLSGKHVLVFEDVVDSGLTLQYLQTLLSARNPASVRTCTLLLKPESLRTKVSVDYVGFSIGNEFVVGYGLDYNEKLRGLPFVGCLENEH